MGERGVRNAEVRGSIPLISTYLPKIVINSYHISEINVFYIYQNARKLKGLIYPQVFIQSGYCFFLERSNYRSRNLRLK
jgi:hypothetical protein